MHLHNISFDLTVVFILIFLILLIRFIWRDSEKRAVMSKFLQKAQAVFKSDNTPKDLEATSPKDNQSMPPPMPLDVTRYRYHHGANLGSIFILERWLTGSMFHESAKGGSELSAAESWVKVEGVEKARQRFEKHWMEYVSDADLDWLRDLGRCTTVRLPIGYFTLGPPYCDRTPFEKVSAVYQNAWQAVKYLVGRCNARGIGVLIDLHGLPGGANPNDHSGTDSSKAEFWNSRSNRDLATRCILFIAQQARNMEGVAGIQIVNEAEFDAKGMYDWYETVLLELSKTDTTVPIYISDAWNLSKAISWSQSKNNQRQQPCNPIVVDTHKYWCFSDQDKQKSAQQIISEVPKELSELDNKDGSVVDRGAAQVVVGEYSCVLDEATWSKSHGAAKEQNVRDFGTAESQLFQRRAGGSFFWTYRMDWMPGGEWGFRQMSEQHAIQRSSTSTLAPQDVRSRIDSARSQQPQRKQQTVSAHSHYWDTTAPGHYEHWRFEQGWELGFFDAMGFFGMRSQQNLAGSDKIGMLDLWCLKRFREGGQSGALVWEWEHGFRQGVRDFYECAGV